MKRHVVSLSMVAVPLIALLLIAFFFARDTERTLRAAVEEQVIERQSSNMAVAWEVIGGKSQSFRFVDGQLYANERLISANNEAVDKIQTLIGGTATIFSGDLGISTNVRHPDGTRAIGTILEDPRAVAAVFNGKAAYRGNADIFGQTYYTAYDPIISDRGDVIGVLHVGMPAKDLEQAIGQTIQHSIVLVWLAALVVGVVVTGSVVVGLRQHRIYEQRVEYAASHDALTGLHNRADLEAMLDRLTEDRRWCSLAALFIDLDNFKTVNDRLGHQKGDEVLRLAAAAITSNVRDTDYVARLGGDEFVVVVCLGPQNDAALADIIAGRIMRDVAAIAVGDGLCVGASIGIAMYPHHANDVRQVLRLADEAMYRVKVSGKNGSAYSGKVCLDRLSVVG